MALQCNVLHEVAKYGNWQYPVEFFMVECQPIYNKNKSMYYEHFYTLFVNNANNLHFEVVTYALQTFLAPCKEEKGGSCGSDKWVSSHN